MNIQAAPSYNQLGYMHTHSSQSTSTSIRPFTQKVVDNYILEEHVGEGQFGKVYRARNKITNQLVAIKVVKAKKFKENPKLEECTVNEIKTLQIIEDNKHVVSFIELLKSSQNFYFVYEYCNGGTLENILQKSGVVKEKEVLLILQQLIEAFRTLRKYNIMHRDLKLTNILLHNGVVKIADFGFCKSLTAPDQMAQTMLGSPLYMAPEILKGEDYGPKTDIWSLGVLLYELLYGFCPFQEKSIAKLISLLNEAKLIFPQGGNISEKTKLLLRSMLTVDPEQRVSWTHLFKIEISPQGEYVESKREKITSFLQDEQLQKQNININIINEQQQSNYANSIYVPYQKSQSQMQVLELNYTNKDAEKVEPQMEERSLSMNQKQQQDLMIISASTPTSSKQKSGFQSRIVNSLAKDNQLLIEFEPLDYSNMNEIMNSIEILSNSQSQSQKRSSKAFTPISIVHSKPLISNENANNQQLPSPKEEQLEIKYSSQQQTFVPSITTSNGISQPIFEQKAMIESCSSSYSLSYHNILGEKNNNQNKSDEINSLQNQAQPLQEPQKREEEEESDKNNAFDSNYYLKVEEESFQNDTQISKEVQKETTDCKNNDLEFIYAGNGELEIIPMVNIDYIENIKQEEKQQEILKLDENLNTFQQQHLYYSIEIEKNQQSIPDIQENEEIVENELKNEEIYIGNNSIQQEEQRDHILQNILVKRSRLNYLIELLNEVMNFFEDTRNDAVDRLLIQFCFQLYSLNLIPICQQLTEQLQSPNIPEDISKCISQEIQLIQNNFQPIKSEFIFQQITLPIEDRDPLPLHSLIPKLSSNLLLSNQNKSDSENDQYQGNDIFNSVTSLQDSSSKDKDDNAQLLERENKLRLCLKLFELKKIDTIEINPFQDPKESKYVRELQGLNKQMLKERLLAVPLQ